METDEATNWVSMDQSQLEDMVVCGKIQTSSQSN